MYTFCSTGAADNDIALIQLETDGSGHCARFDNRTRPICLPRRIDQMKSSDSCYITGWGYTSNSGGYIQSKFSDLVQRAKVEVTPFSKCKDAYRLVKSKHNFFHLPVKKTRVLLSSGQ